MPDNHIDLREDMFAVEADPRMPLGYCAIIRDGECIYAGQVNDSPVPTSGVLMILHPDDYKEVTDVYKKHIN